MTEFEDWIAKKEARRGRRNAPKITRRDKPQPRARKKPRKRKAGFSEEIRTQAHDRAGGLCENPLCGRPLPGLGGEHHCLPRSQYKKRDRNDLWNCGAICQECHHRVTFPRTDEDKRLRRYFELVAQARRDLQLETLVATLARLEAELRNNTLDLIRQFQPFTK